MTDPLITKDDLRAKFDELAGTVERPIEDARDTMKKAAVGGLVLVVIVAFVLGRRRGRKRRTIIEIKRI